MRCWLVNGTSEGKRGGEIAFRLNCLDAVNQEGVTYQITNLSGKLGDL